MSVQNTLAKELNEYNDSYGVDRRLFLADIRINIAYCSALFHAGVLTRIESERIKNGLQTVLKRADFNRNYFEELGTQDIHAFVEKRLVQLIGELGEKITIGRSRNDRNATTLRLWMREEIEEISKSVRVLQLILIKAGENQMQAVLPIYARSNKSQTVLWAHWCLAYFEMFGRDRERLDEVWRRVNVLPLGSADLAGTSFEVDREEIARELGFEGVSANSLDAATDADFTIEFGAACTVLTIHLSRMAEDLILYHSPEFNFIRLTSMTANSSLPIAKNFDNLELIRGKASRITGNQTALLSMLNGMPLGIYKDLQATQEIIFGTVDALKYCLKIIRNALENIRVNERNTRAAAMTDYQNAAELVDYLVHREIPLKIARDVAGKIITLASSKDKKLEELSLEEMRQFSADIKEDIFEALNLEQTLANKNQIGGTAPERVSEALQAAKESLDREEN